MSVTPIICLLIIFLFRFTPTEEINTRPNMLSVNRQYSRKVIVNEMSIS